VLLRGLDKDPKLRWASCGEMVGALQSALAARPAEPVPSQTIPMAPPMPSTAPPRPAEAGTATSSIAPPPANLPDIKYVPGRAAKVRGPSRRPPRILVWLGAALAAVVVLVTAGALIYEGLQPAVSVSPSTAHPGDQVLVTARNVPSGLDGQVQAFGTSQDFTAGSGGQVSVLFNVPPGTSSGTYTVSVCWDGACRASTSITIAGGPASSPLPQASPSASPSSQPTPLTISVVPRVGIVPGRTSVTVSATGLAPGAATITLAQGATREFWDAIVAANGSVSRKVVLSTAQPWARGAAFIKVCDVQYRCTAPVEVAIG
jgi:hypothetical protein